MYDVFRLHQLGKEIIFFFKQPQRLETGNLPVLLLEYFHDFVKLSTSYPNIGWQNKNPTIYNIMRWFAGPMGQTTRQPSVWRSKYFFFSYRLRALKTLYFHFCNFIKKMNWKGFCKEFCKILWKKIIFGTSETWLTSRLSHRPSEPAYYIVDCQIWKPRRHSSKYWHWNMRPYNINITVCGQYSHFS